MGYDLGYNYYIEEIISEASETTEITKAAEETEEAEEILWAVYRDGKIIRMVSAETVENIYNTIASVKSEVRSLRKVEDGFILQGAIYIEKNTILYDKIRDFKFLLDESVFTPVYSEVREVQRDGKIYCTADFTWSVTAQELFDIGMKMQVRLFYQDNNGFAFRQGLKWVYPSPGYEPGSSYEWRFRVSENVKMSNGMVVFFRQSSANNIYVNIRAEIVTDDPKENRKIRLAYKLAKFMRKHSSKDIIFLFEKQGRKYEEGASILYERLMDEWQPGMKKPYFILNANSDQKDRVPKEYRKNLVKQYSLKHYFLFFFSKTFMGTEQPTTAIEQFINNPLARMKVLNNEYHFIFLQHGVYYMYGLGPTVGFMYRGKGFPAHGKIVCSSETEADHFTDYANFKSNDLIITGLPKFDRSTRNEIHDKIVIMPTYRKWEINQYEYDPTGTTYYHFMKNIFDQVPAELKEKVILIPHPLLKGKFDDTELGKYIPKQYVYDDILKETEVLITDWSSISYDAFYRGCKVIFCWEEKDECVEKFGTRLMLNDDNVFSDVSYSFDDLQELIRKNYYGPQTEEHIEKFRDIVLYHDGKNTDRLYNVLKKQGYLQLRQKKSIANCTVSGIVKKLYTGHAVQQKNLMIKDGRYLLIKNVDYTVSYENNVQVGVATLIIKGIGEYKGTVRKNFRIRYNARTDFEVRGVRDMPYTGEEVTQEIECYFNGELLTPDEHYDVRYENNLERGIASLSVLGRSNKFGGAHKVYFKIL